MNNSQADYETLRAELAALRRRVAELEQAEEALHRREEKYRIVADYTYDWEHWRAPAGQYLYVSPSCERITGYRVDEFLADPDLMERIINPADRPIFDQYREQGTQPGLPASRRLEFRIITRNGEERWIEHECQPVYRADGTWLGRRGSNRDITGRKQAEMALRESEEKFKGVFVASPMAILVYDRAGKLAEANPAALDIFGVPHLEHIIGLNLFDNPSVPLDLLARLATGETVKFQSLIDFDNIRRLGFYQPTRSGKAFVDWVINRFGQGWTLVQIQDITERRQVEGALRQRNAELAALNVIAVSIARSLRQADIINATLDEIMAMTGAVAGRIYLSGAGQAEETFEVKRGFDRAVGERPGWVGLQVPVTAQVKELGILELFRPPSHAWEEREIHLLTAIGYELGIGITNARLFAAVEQQSRQLRTLGLRLVEVEEAERRRLAHELHDQVGQSLMAMGLNLDILRTLLPPDIPGEALARLEDTRALVTGTTKQVRGLMADLRPDMLEDYGIMAALRWYAEQFTGRTHIPVTVEGEETGHRLPQQVENVLYRVVQEALTNVAKHARASQVRLRLELSRKKARLVVVDNGVGFVPARPAASAGRQQWGLSIMAERVEGVGGRFELKSRPGRGVRLIVDIPC